MRVPRNLHPLDTIGYDNIFAFLCLPVCCLTYMYMAATASVEQSPGLTGSLNAVPRWGKPQQSQISRTQTEEV